MKQLKYMMFIVLTMSPLAHIKARVVKAFLVNTFPFSVNDLIGQAKIPEEEIGVDSEGTLDLSNRRLTSLDGLENVTDIERVKRLLLDNNRLSNLKGMPISLSQLTILSLVNNELTSLEGMSNNLPQLTNLFLDRNKLSSLEGMPDNLPKLMLIGLINNPLSAEEKQKIQEKFPYATIYF